MFDNFEKLKSNFLRILGRHDKIEAATNIAELDTALEDVPSLSEQITEEVNTAKELVGKEVMQKMNEQVATLVSELNQNLTGIIASQNQKIEQIAKSVSVLTVQQSKPAASPAPDIVIPDPQPTKGKAADYNSVLSAVRCVPITRI